MKKKNEVSPEIQEDRELLSKPNGFLLFMCIGYWVLTFVSTPEFFTQYWEGGDHGGFFNHLPLLTVVYTLLAFTNMKTKHGSYTWFNTTAYTLFGFFLAFPLLTEIGGIIVGVLLGILAHKRKWQAAFITGALLGYWLLLLFASGMEYNPFLKRDEGFGAMIWEFLGALFNMADYNAHQLTLTWFLPGLLIFGSISYKLFELPTENIQKEQEEPKVATQVAKEIAKEVQASPITPQKEEVISSSYVESTQRKRYKKEEKPSKEFFNITQPQTKIKFKNSWEWFLRRLSK